MGRQLYLEGLEDKNAGTIKPYTIVGVIGDQVDTGIPQPPHPLLMVPYQQIPSTSLLYPALLKTIVSFVVKTHNDIAIAPAMRSIFKQVAPDFAVDNFHTMQQAIDHNNFNDRLGLYLISSFAGLAVLMVVGGLYGVLTQLVNYRRREIAIRLALGATRKSVLEMFLRRGSVLVVAGLVVGLVLALAAGRFVKSFLFGVGPVNMLTYCGVTVLLLAVGILTALVPARRAASAEPLQALREE
jgi:putative ABC transport system permease protein